MAALPQPDHPMTEAEYLEYESQSNIRHEFVDGEIFAMTGASNNHILIVGNLTTELNLQLKKSPCRVMAIDLKLKVSQSKSYRYPDVTVICDEPNMVGDTNPQSLTNPDVIFEVLSPSTSSIDHIQKFEEYTQIDTLKAYLLVEQDEPAIKSFQRTNNNEWVYKYVSGFDSVIAIKAINCTLKLADIYAKCVFEIDNNS